MGMDELINTLRDAKSIRSHPDWQTFRSRRLPRYISFYYTNRDGQEAYWDQARIIKVDPDKLIVTIEGAHGDPLRFEIARIMHCKDAQTGEKVQDLWFDLLRMWRDIHEPEL